MGIQIKRPTPGTTIAVLMSEPAGNLVWLSHPRLASTAMSALPAWLWSIDATRLLWANPTGAAIFDAPTSAAIRASSSGSRGPAAIQVARLAATLRPDGATRFERLSGLGAGIGDALTCACSCITLPDHTRAILVAATERAGDDLPLAERVRRLLAQCSAPIAAFSSEGDLIHASPAAQMRLGGATSLAALGAELDADARPPGPATGAGTAGALTIERVEAEAATILLAIFSAPPPTVPSPPAAAIAAIANVLPASVPAASPATGRRAPLRFVWQMDAEHRFTASDEFVALMGPATAAVLGQPWSELAAALSIDSQSQIALALATRDTWSGLCIAWPVSDGAPGADAPGGGSRRLMVELSGLPVFDRERIFRGYRGFGVCRDVARPAVASVAVTPVVENVVALRPSSQPVVPALSPLERSAFHELTRKLHERLTATGARPPAPDDDGVHPLADAPREKPAAKPSEQPLDRSAPLLDTAAPGPRSPGEGKAADELTAAKRQADKAAAAKSDFLAKISHEIRTPLSAIIGFAEIMAQEKFGPVGNERYRQYLLDILGSGQHLLALVNDLLDLSKIEAGRLDLDFAQVALNPLTQQCVALLAPQANRERIIIRTSLSPKLPPVQADARALRQIVLNMIASSVKLTGAGGQVIVSTTLTDLGEVVLRVRDSGIGLSEREIGLALEPFRQAAATVRNGTTRNGAAGTGLAGTGMAGGNVGLPLAKALAEANRATFSIKSAPHAGTLIEVAFPPG
jgi:signal transduction histidine kinase